MKNKLILIVLLNVSILIFIKAQEPESFFPTQVGNLWQYYGAVTLWQNWSILKDSVADDGYRYLYVGFERYLGQERWEYRIDSASNVYKGSVFWADTFYRPEADSGDVWLPGPGGYSWIFDIYKDVVFGKTETIKVIRSGPLHPDSGGNGFYFTEQHLSSGFGVIYHWEEPYDELFLKGCIINGDTFGVLTSVENINYDLPESFVLKQNYPNPFNPKTQIIYQLPKAEFVNLKIFNILGKEISVLVNELKSAGIYSINFNAKNFSSGIYFYSIKAGDFYQVRKMILVK